MRFLLDESAEFRLAALLRGLGHDVTAIAHDYPSSLADRQVLEIAVREDRVLVTNDRDFGELIFRRGLSHAGVILLRLGSANIEAKAERMAHLVAHRGDDLAEFVVITERGIRVRRSTPRRR